MTAPNTSVPIVDTIGYVRVSTEQQAGEQRTSLPEQLRAISQHAAKLGRVLDPHAVFTDPGASGATAEGRPAFMAMLAYCEAHPRTLKAPGLILVLNDSRFGRFDDTREAQHWQFVLEKLGWIVRFAEGDDIADGLARNMVRLIGAGQATEYRQNLKRTARRSSRATAEKGRWQNEAPFGYRRLATRADGSQRTLEKGQRKSSDEVVRLTLGPESEQALVRSAFETYARGETLGRLVKILVARYPERNWSKGVLNAVLKNPAYVGDVVWCRRPHDAKERRETRVRDRSEWVVVTDAHPPLISRELFAAVALRLKQNKVERRMTSGGYPLSGLITCATCGSGFVGGGGRKGPPGDLDRYRFYRDNGGVSNRPGLPILCDGYIATLRKRWVEGVVVSEIGKVVNRPDVIAVIAEEIDLVLDQAHGNHRERRAALEHDVAELQRKRARIVASIASGVLEEREATLAMAELRATISATEAELDRTKFAARRTAGVAAIRERLIALAHEFAAAAKQASGPTLRELVRPWLASAVLNKHTRVLTLHIRRVPEVLGLGMDLHTSRPQDGHKHNRQLHVIRRIRVPDSPAAAAVRGTRHTRKAGGAR